MPERPHLRRADLPGDPLALLERWWTEATEAGCAEPGAMTLATATPDGRPSARTVLLRGFGADGLRFYTNYASRKARELDANPRGALVLHWRELERQVLVTGEVERVSTEESDAYFASRPRESRLGAWASAQGSPLAGRDELEAQVREAEARFAGEDVTRPDFWGGYRLGPETIEFWQGAPARLHDRFAYMREAGGWTITRLSP